jgi:hypothetical protein
VFGLPVQCIDLPHLERSRKYAPEDKIRIVLEGSEGR